jgi:hypothetical protein
MSPLNTLFLIIGSCVFLIVVWTFNPMGLRVHRLFPSAKIRDVYESPFVPAFMEPYVKFSDDLYDGRYLEIEISDKTVDLNQLRGIPWCFLSLHRCRLSDLSLLKEMNILESHNDVYFDDCDISGVPRGEFTAGFYSYPADPKHFTFSKPP